MFNLNQITGSDIALAISSGMTIYQIYSYFNCGSELTLNITILIVAFTLTICSLKQDSHRSASRIEG
jgi:hypothetical protein